MLRVITLNLNGIRSAARKGFFDWLTEQKGDIVCLQELKAQADDLDDSMRAPVGYHAAFNFAAKRGYSGVAIYSRTSPHSIRIGIGDEEFDREGRYVEANFGAFAVVSIYLPSGSSSPERQRAKFRFMDLFLPRLRDLANCGTEVLMCGDWNIAHKEIDLRNWRSNQRNSGFLPEERAWLSHVLDVIGWVDVFRRLNHDPEQYTWWSNRGQAWAKNVGWRIDYQIATARLAERVRAVQIYKGQRFSDHAPLVVDYEWNLPPSCDNSVSRTPSRS
jgi:exodeoxyribonuclease-3